MTSFKFTPHSTRWSQGPYGEERPLVIAITGIHGDEPEGVLLGGALVELYKRNQAAFNFTLFGAVNAFGLAHHCREMEQDIDGNRIYGGPSSPVHAWEPELWAAVASSKRVVVLDLHSHDSMPVAFYAGDVGEALQTPFRGYRFPFEINSKRGSLTTVAEANGVPSLTIEVTGGQPLGLVPEWMFNGMQRWAGA